MTEREFIDRLEKLSKRMGERIFRASEWNNPTPKGMVENDSFSAPAVMTALVHSSIPRTQAMWVANQLWKQVNK